MNALVTGGAGFIGSNVVRMLLHNGFKVKVLDNLSTGYEKNLAGMDVHFTKGDVRNNALVENISRDAGGDRRLLRWGRIGLPGLNRIRSWKAHGRCLSRARVGRIFLGMGKRRQK